MLLRLLALILPPKKPSPKYYRLGKETEIFWVNYKDKVIYGTINQPAKGDVVMSLRKSGRTKFYRVVSTGPYRTQEGVDAWIAIVDEVSIEKDGEGYPVVKELLKD